VKIYKVKNRDRINYTVSYVDGTGRQRRTFADLEKARAEATNIADNLNKGDLEGLKLTGGDKQIYTKACEAIAPSGVPLISVAHEFARAFDILRGANIVEAARTSKSMWTLISRKCRSRKPCKSFMRQNKLMNRATCTSKTFAGCS
jgi:hypothetical protein